MTDGDVRQLREDMQEFKEQTIDRLARIETRLDTLVGQREENTTKIMGKVSMGVIDWGKTLLQIVAAAIAGHYAGKV